MSGHRLAVVALALTVLAALACNASPSATPTRAPTSLPQSPTRPLVQPTPPPVVRPTQPPATKPAQPTLTPGSISGQLCYPSEGIPPMTIYAVDQATGKSFKKHTTKPDETRYRLDGVAPGTYLVYAWLDNGKLGGAYSRYVTCGQGADCADHALIPVTVKPGQNVTGIDVCDWYGPLPPAPPK